MSVFIKCYPFLGYYHEKITVSQLNFIFFILSIKISWTNLNRSNLKKKLEVGVNIRKFYKILLLFCVKLTILLTILNHYWPFCQFVNLSILEFSLFLEHKSYYFNFFVIIDWKNTYLKNLKDFSFIWDAHASGKNHFLYPHPFSLNLLLSRTFPSQPFKESLLKVAFPIFPLCLQSTGLFTNYKEEQDFPKK